MSASINRTNTTAAAAEHPSAGDRAKTLLNHGERDAKHFVSDLEAGTASAAQTVEERAGDLHKVLLPPHDETNRGYARAVSGEPSLTASQEQQAPLAERIKYSTERGCAAAAEALQEVARDIKHAVQPELHPSHASNQPAEKLKTL